MTESQRELKRIKDILRLTLGMVELLLSEDQADLDKAQKKLEEALESLDDGGLN